MKFSLNWVNEFTDIKDKTLEEIKEAVWTRLSEVESVTDLNQIYGPLKVGKIIEKRKHPQSNKLYIAKVDIGDKIVQVVAGAGNFEVGDFVPYTPVGVKVPVNAYPDKFDGVVKAIKLAGELSEGMLNSEFELGISDDHTGILILKQEELPEIELKPGMSLARALGFDDIIIEIENKSLTHRGDAFSVFGVARELAAIFKTEFNIPKQYMDTNLGEHSTDFSADINIHSADDSPRYSGLVVNNVKIKHSPLWLKAHLAKFGIKSINNVVDITNYILLLFGQPLHAFDYKKAFGSSNKAKVNVRFAKKGEKILALDGKEHELDSDILVIANSKDPIAVAGIIGGEDTAIDDSTKTVFLESATFNQYTIRRGSMKLGIFTDAATVFSRAQDPNKTVFALVYAAKMFKKYAEGVIVSDVLDNYAKVREPAQIDFNFDKAREFLGLNITDNEIKDILTRLDIKIENKTDKNVILTVPTFRFDLNIKEDIYEEIIRIYGYEKLRLVSPLRDVKPVAVNKSLQISDFVKDLLSNKGLYEVVNFNFVSKGFYEKLGLSLDNAFKIVNAVSKEVEFIRTLALPSLINNVAYNWTFVEEFGMFELGRTFRKNCIYGNNKNCKSIYIPEPRFAKDEDDLPVEDKHLAGIIAVKENIPYYTIKLYIDYLAQKLHIDIEYIHVYDLEDNLKKELPEWYTDILAVYKKGRTAYVVANKNNQKIVLGVVGELSSLVNSSLGIKQNLAGFELSWHLLEDLSDITYKFREPSKYPVVWQDLCFVVNKDIPYAKVVESIWQVNKNMEAKGYEPLIKEIKPIDIYVPEENQELKQITLRIVLQSYNKTLKDKDIKVWRSKIIDSVIKNTGGSLKE